LRGDKSSFARFGSYISAVGDLNGDGFKGECLWLKQAHSACFMI